MPSRRNQRILATGLTAALLATATTLTAAVSPTAAAAPTVTFTKCDIRTDPYNSATRVGPEFSWTTTVAVELDTPVAETNEFVGIDTTLGTFPWPDTLPRLYNLWLSWELEMPLSDGAHDDAGNALFPFEPDERQPAGPLTLTESEREVIFPHAGVYDWRAGKFALWVSGYTSLDADEPTSYYAQCGKPASATSPVLASLGVWDPAAAARLSFPASVVQGRSATITAASFKPRENVTYSIDGVRLATKPTGLAGSGSQSWTAGAWLKPGTHTVSVHGALSTKTLTKRFTVVAAKAKAALKPKSVTSGRKTKVTGSHFKPGEKVTIVLKRTSSGKGKKSQTVATVTAATNGTVQKKFRVSKKFKKGTHRVTLTGASSGRSAAATLKVKKPS